jgi:replication factor C subunit 2/4
MSNFFDLKARKAAAANGAASSSAEKQTNENTRVQPWVEK